MATKDFTSSNENGSLAVPSKPGPQWVKGTVNAATTAVATTDIAKAIFLQAGCFIHNVYIHVKTAEGGVATALCGLFKESDDSAVDADGFGKTGILNLNSATKQTDSTGAYAGIGVPLSADSWIGLTPENNLDTAVVDVYALVSSPEAS